MGKQLHFFHTAAWLHVAHGSCRCWSMHDHGRAQPHAPSQDSINPSAPSGLSMLTGELLMLFISDVGKASFPLRHIVGPASERLVPCPTLFRRGGSCDPG